MDTGPLDQLSIWDSPNCVFIVSSNTNVTRSNVMKIPGDYLESQKYILLRPIEPAIINKFKNSLGDKRAVNSNQADLIAGNIINLVTNLSKE